MKPSQKKHSQKKTLKQTKPAKTPLILLSGYLGSGKTTLLKHILDNTDRKIAVLMNEFGEIGIDTATIKKKHINVKEILEGCVCCSLEGEFEAAVREIIKDYAPETVILETTGIAEPDNIMTSISDDLDFLRLDTVITVVDADVMNRFPEISRTARIQIEAADLIIVNKIDLVTKSVLLRVKKKVREINSRARMIDTSFCRVDADLLFSIEVEHHVAHKHHPHQHAMEHFSVIPRSFKKMEIDRIFENMPREIFRAKGFVLVDGKKHLLNYVAGRWNVEEAVEDGKGQQIVFIGENIKKYKDKVIRLWGGKNE